MKGTVVKLNYHKQYVFIAGDDQTNYFSHFGNFEDAFLPCDESLIGQRVAFDSSPGLPGKAPRALNVTRPNFVPEAMP